MPIAARKLDISDIEPSPSQSGSARKIELDQKDISRFRSLISAPLKGLLKELPSFSKFTDPVSLFLPKSGAEKFYEEEVEKRLPTKEGFAEKTLERGAKLAPYFALGGGGIAGSLGRAGLAALGGQATEELGGGPLLQSGAELVASGLPSLGRKIVPSSKDQEAILSLGRKFGLTEEQLAPMMPEGLKKRFFGKLASSGEKTKDLLKSMREGGKAVYEGIKGSPEATKKLSDKEALRFGIKMQKLGQDMPHAVRTQLKNDALDLVNSAREKGGITGSDLMNFYKDVSSRYNLGRSELELFKGPIKDAISSIDPRLAKDFDTANKIWARQAQISSILSPGQYENLINMGEAVAVASAAAKGDLGLLSKILGVLGYRKFSNAMLTSPRLQNMIEKSQNALESNNIARLKPVGDLILKSYKEESED